jgi:predicted ATPase
MCSVPSAVPAAASWRLQLLGDVILRDPGGQVVPLSGRFAVELLARLALPPQRAWAREELTELLWPGVAAEVGRNRLRQLLSVLVRSTATDASGATGALLQANRRIVRLRSDALRCDADDPCAPGELMPGHYAQWVIEARREREGASPLPVIAARRTLPHALTRWRGDPAQCQRLCERVRGYRLVTVTGAGGSGKTRVALEAAHALSADFERIVWVPLAACRSLPAMLDQCLDAIGRSGGGDALADLAAALSGRSVLLLLDNVEQLAAPAVATIGTLAETLPGLHLLLTSRRALDLDGEQVFALPTLGAPAPQQPLAALARHPAMALLLDRAQAVRPDFRLDADNAPALIALLQQLDGLPLAIELAAPRLRATSPQTLLDMLRAPEQAFALLARDGARNGHDDRHASMLETLRWSWSLLSAPARSLLDALSVFDGPFDAAAAEAVYAAPAALALDELVRHSLLTHGPGPVPYSLHPLMREAVQQGLTGERRLALRTALRHWAAAWAAALPPGSPLVTLRLCLPNLAAAMHSAEADGDPAAALALFLALQRALSDISLPQAVRESLLRSAASLPVAESRAVAWAGLARAALRAGDGAQVEHAAALALQALPGLPATGLARATVLARVAHLRWRLHRDAGVAPWLDEALVLARRHGARALEGSVLSVQGAMRRPSDPDAAAALQRGAIEAWLAVGDLHGVHAGRYNLALALGMRAATRPVALAEIDQVIDATRAAGDWGQLANAFNQRGELLRAARRWDEAVAAYRAGIRVADDAFERLPLAYCLWNLPLALVRRRDALSATLLMGCAAATWANTIGPLTDSDQRDLRHLRRLAAAQIGQARMQQAWWEGERLTPAAAVRLALDAG